MSKEEFEALDKLARYQAMLLWHMLAAVVEEGGRKPTLEQAYHLYVYEQLARKGVLHCRNN